MSENKYLSSVKMVDGSVYNIKDAKVRDTLFGNELIIDCGGAPLNEEAYISSIKMQDGSVYNVKDDEVHDILFNELVIDCGGAPIDE